MKIPDAGRMIVLVSQLAKELNVSSDTVRFYTRAGCLKPIKDAINGYKNYDSSDKRRLRFIVGARQVGFSVDDIKQILSVSDKGKTPCPLVKETIRRRLMETRQRFEEIRILRDHMERALNEWTDMPDKLPNGEMICHLIDGWQKEESEEEGYEH